MNQSLADALYEAISGEPAELDDYSPAWLPQLRDAAGGFAQLARALGVARTTVQGWFGARGGGRVYEPSDESKALMQVVMRHIRGIASQRVARAAHAVTVYGIDRYENRYREITFREGRDPGLRTGTPGRTVDGYLADGAEGAHDRFTAGIVDRGRHYTSSGNRPGWFESGAPDFGIDVERVEFHA